METNPFNCIWNDIFNISGSFEGCLPMLRFHNNWQNLGNHLQRILAFQGRPNGRGGKKCKQSLVGRWQEMSMLKPRKVKYQFRSISSVMGESLDLLDKWLLYWHTLDSVKIDSTTNGGESSSSERFWSYCSYVPCGHLCRGSHSRVWLEALALPCVHCRNIWVTWNLQADWEEPSRLG